MLVGANGPLCSDSDVTTLARAFNFSDGSIGNVTTTVSATCMTCINGNASNVDLCASLPPDDSCTQAEAWKPIYILSDCVDEGGDCSDFFGNLTALSPTCNYCYSYYLLDDPVNVYDGNQVIPLCAGAATNGTCPFYTAKLLFEAANDCDDCPAWEALEIVEDATSDECVYCFVTSPLFNNEACYESLPPTQNCSNAKELIPVITCADNFDPNATVSPCANVLDNLTVACAACVTYEEFGPGDISR